MDECADGSLADQFDRLTSVGDELDYVSEQISGKLFREHGVNAYVFNPGAEPPEGPESCRCAVKVGDSAADAITNADRDGG